MHYSNYFMITLCIFALLLCVHYVSLCRSTACIDGWFMDSSIFSYLVFIIEDLLVVNKSHNHD